MQKIRNFPSSRDTSESTSFFFFLFLEEPKITVGVALGPYSGRIHSRRVETLFNLLTQSNLFPRPLPPPPVSNGALYFLRKLKTILVVVARRYDGGTIHGSMTVVSAGRRRPVLGPNPNLTY